MARWIRKTLPSPGAILNFAVPSAKRQAVFPFLILTGTTRQPAAAVPDLLALNSGFFKSSC